MFYKFQNEIHIKVLIKHKKYINKWRKKYIQYIEMDQVGEKFKMDFLLFSKWLFF